MEVFYLYGINATFKCVGSTLDNRRTMTTVEMTRERQCVEESSEYRHRMFVNALATVFITVLIITGYWVVNTLAG
jgi:hypothetical protein